MPWTLVRQSLELPLLRRLDGLFIQPESERLRNLHLSGETALANRSAEQHRPFEFGQPLLISVVWVCFLNRLDGGTNGSVASSLCSLTLVHDHAGRRVQIAVQCLAKRSRPTDSCSLGDTFGLLCWAASKAVGSPTYASRDAHLFN